MAWLYGSTGADTLLGTTADDEINGSYGADILYGNGGNDRLVGGLGSDTIYGGAGNDLMRGESDQDTFVIEKFNTDNLDIIDDFNPFDKDIIDISALGIASFSTLRIFLKEIPYYNTDDKFIDWAEISIIYQGAINKVTIKNSWNYVGLSSSFILSTDNTPRTITGSDKKSDLIGGLGADRLSGGIADERLLGDSGDDVLIGGGGNDTIFGGAGKDIFVIDGKGFTQIADFKPGEDKIDVSALGITTLEILKSLSGPAATREIYSLGYANFVPVVVKVNGVDLRFDYNRPESGQITANDFIFAPTALNILSVGSPASEDLIGSSGNDTLFGGRGDDRLLGGLGDDELTGGGGVDTLIGGAGNDVFIIQKTPYDTQSNTTTVADFETGRDRIDLSGVDITGFDVLSQIVNHYKKYSVDSRPVVTLNLGNDIYLIINVAPDSLSARDFIFAAPSGPFNKTRVPSTSYNSTYILGSNSNDTLTGSSGNDLLFAGDGDDRISGGLGDNQAYGGAGRDVFVVTAPPPELIGTPDIRQSLTIHDFDLAADRLDLSALAITNFGDLGTRLKSLNSSLTALEIRTHNGVSVVYLNGIQVDQLRAEHFIFAPRESDSMFGGDGFDNMHGGAGNDTILAGRGDDYLYGEAGDDLLFGGDGNDTFFGGEGSDIFIVGGTWQPSSGITDKDTIEDFVPGQDRIDLSMLRIPSLAAFKSMSSDSTVNGRQIITFKTTINLKEVELKFAGSINNISENDFIFSSGYWDDILGYFGNPPIFGDSSSNGLVDTQTNSRIFGLAGDDTISAGSGNDILQGGLGIDTATYFGPSTDYSITTSPDGRVIVKSNSGNPGTDILSGVEYIEFDDKTISAFATPILSYDAKVVRYNNQLFMEYNFKLQQPAQGEVDFIISQGQGTAISGRDFTPIKTGYVTIHAGESSATTKVALVGGDTGAYRTIALNIHQLTGATLPGNIQTIIGEIGNKATTAFAHAYEERYPDLAAAFGGDPDKLLAHYLQYGYNEGRVVSGFSPDAYAARNADLFFAFGTDHVSLVRHYIQFGYAEGRTAKGFDIDAYAALNPDLFAAFGLNRQALINHYVMFGRTEGRLSDGFDVETYARLNPDLLVAFGHDQQALINHYIQFGRAEGRAAFAPDMLSTSPLGLVGLPDLEG